MGRVTTILLLTVLLSVSGVDAQITSYGQYADTLSTSYGTGSFVWAWIHLPSDFFLRPAKKYPLIFFFHGAGQASIGGENALDSLIGTTSPNALQGAGPAWLINQGDSMNFYNYATQDTDRPIIVSPQFPGWSATGPAIDVMIGDLLYGKSRFAGRIDSNRISLTGLSAGGQGAFDELSGFDDDGCRCLFHKVHKIASAVLMSAALDHSTAEMPAYPNIIADSTRLWGMGSLIDIHGISTLEIVDSIDAYAGGAAAYLTPAYYEFPNTGSYYESTSGHCCWLAEYEPTFTQVINGHPLNVYQFMLSHSRVGLSPSPPVSDLHPAGGLPRHRAAKVKLN